MTAWYLVDLFSQKLEGVLGYCYNFALRGRRRMPNRVERCLLEMERLFLRWRNDNYELHSQF